MTDQEAARPLVSTLVLAFGDEPLLEQCVAAIRASSGIVIEVLVVDNGCSSEAVSRLDEGPDLRVLRPGRNTGFTGGCNLAASHARGDVLVLVNSDVIVEPSALAHLASALDHADVGIATGLLLTLGRDDEVNSAGNPVHYTGLSWAGGQGEPAAAHGEPRAVASACGGLMAIRTQVWNELEGFFEPMFAYGEDVELSLRCWLSGRTVCYVPTAVGRHAYDFARLPQKMYLLERNRLVTLLTVYQSRTLALLAGPLLAVEVFVLLLAWRQGWWRQKVAGWTWLMTHGHLLRERRRGVQSARRHGDRRLGGLLEDRFSPAESTGMSAPAPLEAVSGAFWRQLVAHLG